jgi:hypothetical protein
VYPQGVYATGWNNGHSPNDPAGYGLSLTKADRDRYFDSSWDQVFLEFVGDEPEATVPLSASFWRGCSELRSAAIGRWLLKAAAAPWSQGNPPGVVLTQASGNRFTARLLERRVLGR